MNRREMAGVAEKPGKYLKGGKELNEEMVAQRAKEKW